MTQELTPRPFRLESQNGVVDIADVTLHQSIEADADGRLWKRVWIEGCAVPKLAREKMAVELDFVLYAGEENLGTCELNRLAIDKERETIDFIAKGGLRIPRNTEVSRIEMRLAATTVNRFGPVDLNPQPLPPAPPD